LFVKEEQKKGEVLLCSHPCTKNLHSKREGWKEHEAKTKTRATIVPVPMNQLKGRNCLELDV
jgi:hypothetical protein